MAKEAVLKFMEDQNRPFSLNDVLQNVKGDFGKSAVQKGLDSLVSKGKVREKAYGKQKVYFVTQTNEVSSNEMKENLLEMDRKIHEVTLQLKEVTDKVREKSTLVGDRKRKMTLEEAVEQKEKLEKELEVLKNQLKQYDTVQVMDPKDKDEIKKEYDKNFNEFRKRKRMCLDVLDSILENYPKTKKHLYEEIGIETDEDAGFSVEK